MNIEFLAYGAKDNIYGKHFAMGMDREKGFITLTVHAAKNHPEFFAQVTGIYNRLGFSNTEFDPAALDNLDLGNHLSPKSKERLGYGTEEKVPGYRFRLQTTPDYLDSDRGRIDIDLIMPVTNSTAGENNIPVFYLLPRPEAPYCIFETVAYPLNVRLMRREFKAETGFDLLRYLFNNKPTKAEKLDPFYPSDYQPFINNRKAFENKPEYDFLKWQGEPLPTLFP
ncbi:MAG: hypothetical protein GY702_01560 [Desulfobulbaceae bacterium]|nr:hypothetical protein [Desulfobulbaceae bacterium]